MPTDETYVHALDVWGGFGPWWMLVAAVVLLLGILAWRSIPLVDERKKKELSIQEEAQRIRREEIALQNKQREDDAANNARFADAMNRTADSENAMAAALNAIVAKFDVSSERSAHMGEQVETIAHQVEDIHAITVRNQRN
jgi:hypothetical protein